MGRHKHAWKGEAVKTQGERDLSPTGCLRLAEARIGAWGRAPSGPPKARTSADSLQNCGEVTICVLGHSVFGTVALTTGAPTMYPEEGDSRHVYEQH